MQQVIRTSFIVALLMTLIVVAARLLGSRLPTEQIAFDAPRIINGGWSLTPAVYLGDMARNLFVPMTPVGQGGMSAVWSPDGEWLAYLSGLDVIARRPETGERETLVSLDALAVQGTGTALSWSSDGEWLAITMTNSAQDGQGLYMVRTDGTGLRRLSRPPGGTFTPSWSPTGGPIAFSWSPVANAEIYLLDASLALISDSHTTFAAPAKITQNMYTDTAPSWSPDGSQIAFVSDRIGNSDVYLMLPNGEDLYAITADPAYDGMPTWSPDGMRLAFSSHRDQGDALYSMNRDGTDVRRITPAAFLNPTRPAWRPRP